MSVTILWDYGGLKINKYTPNMRKHEKKSFHFLMIKTGLEILRVNVIVDSRRMTG